MSLLWGDDRCILVHLHEPLSGWVAHSSAPQHHDTDDHGSHERDTGEGKREVDATALAAAAAATRLMVHTVALYTHTYKL